MRLHGLGLLRPLGIRPAPELERALAVEHDEELLLEAVAVRRRAALPLRERKPVQAARLRARRLARVLDESAVVDLEALEVDDLRRPPPVPIPPHPRLGSRPHGL